MTRKALRANNWAGLIGARRRSDNNAISRWILRWQEPVVHVRGLRERPPVKHPTCLIEPIDAHLAVLAALRLEFDCPRRLPIRPNQPAPRTAAGRRGPSTTSPTSRTLSQLC